MPDEPAPTLPIPTPYGKQAYAPEKDDFGALAEMLCGLFTDPIIRLEDHGVMMQPETPPGILNFVRGSRALSAAELTTIGPWVHQAFAWGVTLVEGARRIMIGVEDDVIFWIRASHPDLLEATLLRLDAKPEDVTDL